MSLKDGSLLPGWPVDRDFAMLMIEAARSLGFGSRFASRYLAVPLADPTELLNTAWDSRSANIISFVAEGGAGKRLTDRRRNAMTCRLLMYALDARESSQTR
jgi:hypothetical protein